MNPSANVGTIYYDARIDSKQFTKDAQTIEDSGRKAGDSLEDSADRADNRWATAAKAGLAAGVAATLSLAAAGIRASQASWDQVDAVQQATVGLRAYEKDGDKVNQVLSELIKYARSDMGVLFNRKDLFQSAQMMKLNGVETGSLSKNVEILSRSVGLGLGNWQDLNAVIGRVVSSGRLSGIEFDMLTQYGYKLDSSLRNTDISANDLFKTLDKGIPVEAMAGQATTIRGLGIRIESAFRSVGDAILGVDADTSTFVNGGLGSLIVSFMDRLPAAIKTVTPVLRTFMQDVIDTSISTVDTISTIFSKASAVTSSMFSDIRSGNFEGVGETIGKGLRRGIDGAIQGIKIGIDSIKSFFGSIDFVDVGKFIVTKIIPGIAIGLIAGLGELDIIEDILKPIGDNIVPVLMGILSIALAPAKLIGPLVKVLGKVPILGTFLNWIIKGLRGGVEPIRDAIGSLFSGAGKGIVNAFSKIGTFLGAIRDFVMAPFRMLVDNIALVIRLIPTSIANSFNAGLSFVKTILVTFRDVIVNSFNGVVDAIRFVFQPIAAFFSNLFSAIWTTVTGIITPMGSFFAQIGIRIIESLAGIPLAFFNLFMRARSLVVGVFDNIAGFFGSVFSNIFNAITGVFSKIGGFFQGVWNNIVSIFGNAGTSVGNAIGNAFKNVINTVLSKAAGIFNGFINAINGAVDTINKIPGVKIGKIGTLPIPQLAAGGIVSSPTLAMIGEGRESEAVIPLSKLDAMINSDRNSSTSGGDIKIELNMSGIMTRSKSDMRVVAGDLIESINEQLRARQLPEIGDGNLRKGIA